MIMRTSVFGLAALSSVLIVGITTSAEAQVSTSVSVSGDVATPSDYTLQSLQALPQVTQTDTYTAGGSPVTDTFTGPTVWNVLTASGGIVTNPAVKNDVLNKYVIATGTDGYTSVISAGDIAPQFGNKSNLVAIQDTAGTLPGSSGLARVTAPGSVAGGQYVSNLATLTVASAPTLAGTGGGTSTSFKVDGAVTTPTTFNLAALEALAPHTETVTYQSGGTPVTDTYTGALLWNVLGLAQPTVDPSIKNDILRDLVTVVGSDGYQVTFSLGELDTMFGNEPILVAYSDTDGQFGANGDGFARLVVPGDIAGGRYVSNIVEMSVFDGVANAVPEPSTWAMMMLGFCGLGMMAYRRQNQTGIRAA
jgi:hypothetical protein